MAWKRDEHHALESGLNVKRNLYLYPKGDCVNLGGNLSLINKVLAVFPNGYSISKLGAQLQVQHIPC